MHPLLVADAEAANAPVEPVVETATTEAPVEAEAPAAASVDPFEGKYVLSKDNPYQDMLRLSAEDENFRNHLNTYAGRTAKRKYEPEIETLKAELEAARFENMRAKFQAMKPEDIERQFASDPKFAEDYAKAVHGKAVDIEAVRSTIAARSQFERDLERAEDTGVLPARLKEVRGWVESGAFDKDATGRKLTPLESYAWFKGIVDGDIEATRKWRAEQAQAATPAPRTETPSTTAAAAPERVVPQANARLSEATPDLSQAATSSGNEIITHEQYRQMTRAEMMAKWPNDGDFKRDVQAGRVLLD
jgi:hypothetical protein